MNRAFHIASTVVVSSLCIAVASNALADEEVAAPPAKAESPAPFGSAHQIAFDDLLGTRFGSSASGYSSAPSFYSTGLFSFNTAKLRGTSPASGGDVTTTTVMLSPSFDYFVADHWSIGGELALGYTSAKGTNAGVVSYEQSGVAFAVRPRVGYVVRLGDDLALWPRASLGFDYGNAKVTMPDGETRVPSRAFEAEVELGLLARLGKHAYLNIGPTLSAAVGTMDPSSATAIAYDSTSISAGARARFGLIF